MAMEKLDAIIAQVFDVKQADITDDMNMDNLATWDSLRGMELVATLESEFAFELTFDEIIDMTSVAKIREIVEKKIG